MGKYHLKREESFSAFGFVEIRPFDIEDGQKVFREDEIHKCNLIVDNGRSTLLDILTGVTNKKLKFIRWGKGGAKSFPDGDPLYPLTVDDADMDVAIPLLDKVLHIPNVVSTTERMYVETLISDEVNDVVNEAAMMFEDADTFDRTIFARITFPTISLPSTRGSGIEIRWTFNFSRARSS